MDLQDQVEFVSLLIDHQPTLRAFVFSQLPGAPGSADVVQQTNLILWEKRETFKIGTNFRAWMYKVARYQIISHRRKLAKNHFPLMEKDLAEVLAEECSPDPEDLDIRMELLERCLTRLSKKERRLVEQRYTKEEPLTDYAAKIGESPAAMRVTLNRIRATLRKCINYHLLLHSQTNQT